MRACGLRASDCLGLGARSYGRDRRGLVLDRIAAEQHVPGSGPLWLYPFLVAAVSAPAVLGALIVARHPHNRIGWILVVGALSLAAVLAATPYVWVALYAHPGSLPGGSWAALVSSCGRRSSLGRWPWRSCSPDGRLPSPRWRPYVLRPVSVTSLVLLLVIADQLEEPFSEVRTRFRSGSLRLSTSSGSRSGWPCSRASSSERRRHGRASSAPRG